MFDIFLDQGANADHLINAIKKIPGLSAIYETKVRHYLLENHTKLVLGQFDHYFSNLELPMDRALFRFMLVVHDIGKPDASKENNLANQYHHTLRLIKELQPVIPFKDEEIACCLAIINGDPLGLYFQNIRTRDQCVKHIEKFAATTTLTLSDFFRSITIYYQCDTAAYTKDAGGLPFLEKIFAYRNGVKQMDEKRGILQFSPTFEMKYNQLEISLL